MKNTKTHENESTWPDRRRTFPVIMTPTEAAQFLRLDRTNHTPESARSMNSDKHESTRKHDLAQVISNSELMTESEVIRFLRIPEISNSKNYRNVIEHLKKFRGLPRIHICRKALYPKKAILEWMEKETDAGK